MKLIQLWMRLFNWLMVIQGTLITIFGIYISAVAFSSFCYVLFSVGVYTLIVGLTGIYMLGHKNRRLVVIYSTIFFLLLVVHLIMVCGFLFAEDKTIEGLKDLNKDGDNEKIKNYLDSHRDDLKYAGLVVLIIEGTTFLMSVLCVARVSGQTLDEMLDLEDAREDKKLGLLSADAEMGASATPVTDSRRAEMVAKYGNRFAKKQTTNYEPL